jgi:predicted nuclease with TOPRIM domain
MKTLQEDIDDLDRMVDTGAAKDAIRSQIRLIAREVARLEAECSGLAQAYQELHAGLEEKIAKLQERDKKALRDWFHEQAQKQAELRKSHSLNYDA